MRVRAEVARWHECDTDLPAHLTEGEEVALGRVPRAAGRAAVAAFAQLVGGVADCARQSGADARFGKACEVGDAEVRELRAHVVADENIALPRPMTSMRPLRRCLKLCAPDANRHERHLGYADIAVHQGSRRATCISVTHPQYRIYGVHRLQRHEFRPSKPGEVVRNIPIRGPRHDQTRPAVQSVEVDADQWTDAGVLHAT